MDVFSFRLKITINTRIYLCFCLKKFLLRGKIPDKIGKILLTFRDNH